MGTTSLATEIVTDAIFVGVYFLRIYSNDKKI